MYFTNRTTTTAVAIVAMAVSHFALIKVAAAPVTLSQSDYLKNGQDAQKLNKAFQNITVQDTCTGMSEVANERQNDRLLMCYWMYVCSWRRGLYRWQLCQVLA
jgi:hypothetical protein